MRNIIIKGMECDHLLDWWFSYAVGLLVTLLSPSFSCCYSSIFWGPPLLDMDCSFENIHMDHQDIEEPRVAIKGFPPCDFRPSHNRA